MARSRVLFVCTIAAACTVFAYGFLRAQSLDYTENAQDMSASNPIPTGSTLALEELTWMGVRDRIKAGDTRIIIPTGGIEQNGPFVTLNKHDLIVRTLSIQIARELTHTLVAPVVSFVPEGSITPPSGHMKYPGTISLSEDTFVHLLQDIGLSLGSHGFREIILLGDSGQSQNGMKTAATRLQSHLASSGVQVIFVPEFYDYDSIRTLIRERGIAEKPERFHEELAFSLQLLAINPESINYTQRLAAGHTTLGGVPLTGPGARERLTQLGREILAMRTAKTVAAVRRYLSK
jgi:creatinine amidohydrolase